MAPPTSYPSPRTIPPPPHPVPPFPSSLCQVISQTHHVTYIAWAKGVSIWSATITQIEPIKSKIEMKLWMLDSQFGYHMKGGGELRKYSTGLSTYMNIPFAMHWSRAIEWM
jgi:hypothetical protein